MIELKGVSRRFGDALAVSNLSLTVETGEVCVLVGSSGCGKSTTLRMINRLLPSTAGEILVDGKNVRDTDLQTLRLNMGYAIQGTGLFPHWTVARNIGLVPGLLKWPDERIRERVEELLQLLGLNQDGFADKYPHQLSGGQAQRVGVARALAADPNILLMDEPFGALDAITRETLQNEMLRIKQQLGKTTVFVTHDIDEALRLADRIAVMDQGRLIQYDTPETILRRPASLFVETLVGSQDRGLKMTGLQRVGDAMQRHPHPRPHDLDRPGVSEHETLRQALSLMLWQGSESLPVTDAEGAEIGVITRARIWAGGQ
ncbi:MAG: ABC transporter ATP-binding protein [Marinobacter sp.]|nr:ABC transporter ATP-binding protein [Marinobacter sp.]